MHTCKSEDTIERLLRQRIEDIEKEICEKRKSLQECRKSLRALQGYPPEDPDENFFFEVKQYLLSQGGSAEVGDIVEHLMPMQGDATRKSVYNRVYRLATDLGKLSRDSRGVYSLSESSWEH